MAIRDTITYDVDDHIAEITLDRPPVNAITQTLATELTDAYRTAKNDDAVRAVILTSASDKAFCAGTDIEMAKDHTPGEHREYLETLYFEVHDLQYRMGKPTIAAVNGPARGAGVTLTVTNNCIVASEEANFGYPEIDVGLMPAMHLVHLPRVIGRHKAFELLFTGNPISAAEFEDLGVVNRVTPHDKVLEEARSLARTFAEKPPDMMKMVHNAFMRVNDTDYRSDIENMVDTVSLLSVLEDSHDLREEFVGEST